MSLVKVTCSRLHVNIHPSMSIATLIFFLLWCSSNLHVSPFPKHRGAHGLQRPRLQLPSNYTTMNKMLMSHWSPMTVNQVLRLCLRMLENVPSRYESLRMARLLLPSISSKSSVSWVAFLNAFHCSLRFQRLVRYVKFVVFCMYHHTLLGVTRFGYLWLEKY